MEKDDKKRGLLFTIFNNNCSSVINRLSNVSYIVKSIGITLFVAYTTIIFSIDFSNYLYTIMIFIGIFFSILYLCFLDTMLLRNERRFINLQSKKNDLYESIDISDITKMNINEYLNNEDGKPIPRLKFINVLFSYSQFIWFIVSILIIIFFIIAFII